MDAAFDNNGVVSRGRRRGMVKTLCSAKCTPKKEESTKEGVAKATVHCTLHHHAHFFSTNRKTNSSTVNYLSVERLGFTLCINHMFPGYKCTPNNYVCSGMNIWIYIHMLRCLGQARTSVEVRILPVYHNEYVLCTVHRQRGGRHTRKRPHPNETKRHMDPKAKPLSLFH